MVASSTVLGVVAAESVVLAMHLRAQAEVTMAQAYLTDGNAVTEIDRVLGTSIRERRPGYLAVTISTI
jgi:TPP-dependent 2-oxoacid decarboxylase